MAVPGTWNIGGWTPQDFGVTEWLRSLVGKQASAQVTTNFNNPAVIQAQDAAKKTVPSSGGGGGSYGGTTPTPTDKTTTNPPPGGTTDTGGGGNGGGGGNNDGGNNNNGIDDAAAAQQRAAEAAAEAKRQAAERSYRGKVEAAGVAKGQAKGQYDWLIDALGSNKQDLLNQVTQNETTGLANYDMQQKTTQKKYDSSKQEILQTYRDLQAEQERVMRGSGQGQSSRAQEATLRLNNLLGKDMSNITTNEADSLALIGNAITAFKTQTLNTKTSIEKDTSSKIDKATLDYNQNIQNIDLNTNLSANEREDAYAAAEAQLATDTANIQTWASQQKVEYQKTVASQTGMLNDYITGMTDANGLLNKDVGAKTDATNKLLKEAGFTQMDSETDLTNPTGGVYQSSSKTYDSKDALDADLAAGKITALEYSQQLAKLQGSQAAPSIIASTASTPSATRGGTTLPTSVQNDPLMRAMFS